ncbi:IPT/TIG domain-containing protein [Amycolatopsis sp. NPDC101161]|uniref:IPT/TIG domain-containing protein n=1 Tax=Amycolatopsis sp. NPDC101161 TaxID=3363940 RepID=UPI0038249FA2
MVLLAAAFLPTIWDLRKAAEWRTSVTDWIKSGQLHGGDVVDALHVVARPQGTTNLTRTTVTFLALTLSGLALGVTSFSSANDAADLRKTIITSLLAVLGIVIGFYFGARTAQTSGQASPGLGGAFTAADAEPTIRGLTPGSGRSGDSITITGTGLRSARMMFGTLPAETDPATSTDSQVTVKVPAWPPGYADKVNIVAVSLSGTSKPARFTHVSEGTATAAEPKPLS